MERKFQKLCQEKSLLARYFSADAKKPPFFRLTMSRLLFFWNTYTTLHAMLSVRRGARIKIFQRAREIKMCWTREFHNNNNKRSLFSLFFFCIKDFFFSEYLKIIYETHFLREVRIYLPCKKERNVQVYSI